MQYLKGLKSNALTSSLDQAIERAKQHLLRLQSPQGYWCGELESNVTITAEHLLLTCFLGIPNEKLWQKIARYLLDQQRPDGSWAIFYGGPGDLSTTIEAYFALKLAGISPQDPPMEQARSFILSKGGIPKARIFTKIWLALFGQYPWEGIPIMPPELILLPSWSPFNIYEFASWARGTIVPMLIILTQHPVCPLPKYAKLEELYPSKVPLVTRLPMRGERLFSWKTFFLCLDRVLRLYEGLAWKPGRRYALKKAISWILAHQEADGSWGGIQPPWVYSLIALKTMGYHLTHPVLSKGIMGFERFAIEDEKSFRLQACMSPVWDTALAILALREAGLSPDHPVMLKAGRWLLKEQILSGGDWQVKVGKVPGGGWAFEFDNDLYPDVDDTAIVMMALQEIALPEKEKEEALALGLDWILAMQSRNGGWGAFDKDCTKRFLTQIPFGDFGALIDPPTADVTAHVVELLSKLGYEGKPLRMALSFLRDEQEEDGSWFGRWGVNYIYGTWSALQALASVGEDKNAVSVRRAVEWLLAHQNPDGGWGESCLSYKDPSWKGRGVSTASQTAWAIMGLMSAGEADHPATLSGIRFLIETQMPQGSWEEPYFTGTGFPGDFMINYNLYRLYFPLMALGRYRSALGREG